MFIGISRIVRSINFRSYTRNVATKMTQAETSEILVDQSSPLTLLTLNRPRALNALNTSMIKQITSYLKDWDSDKSKVCGVVMQGAGGKAFCAGGDVKTVVLSPENDRIDFFRREYQMNYIISKFQKPLVCLLDGIVMGGGCGLSMHASFRIATEKSVCAMPECAIGFTPDVGSSYFLNRLPDSIGNYMAMTGKRLKGLELKAVGLATHYVASNDMSLLISKLQEMGEQVRDHSRVDTILKKLEIPGHLDDIQAAYQQLAKMGNLFNPFTYTMGQIVEQLESSNEEEAKEALSGVKNGAPLSVVLAYELLKRNAGCSLRHCLETEATLAFALSRNKGEFAEGVRALLIDKDQNPRWKFSKEEITSDFIDDLFTPSEGDSKLFSTSAKL